jgi:hypothetical protein
MEQYQIIIKNKFAVLDNLDDNGDINRAWETIRENIRISAKESFINHGLMRGLKLVDRRKQAKLRFLQRPKCSERR